MSASSSALKQVSLIIHAGWIIPISEHEQVLKDQSIVVEDGKIVAILPTADAKEHYRSQSELDLPDHAVMPGLINAHGHAAMSLFRGLADDLPLMEWLNDHIWPAEGQWVSEEFVKDGLMLSMAEMIKGGTTCFSDMYFFPEVAAKQASELGMRAQFVCPVLDFPTVWGSGPEEYIAKSIQLAIDYSEHPLIRVGLGPHAPYTVSDEPLKNIRDIAREYDVPVQIHLHETEHEVQEAIEQKGTRPIARLTDIGLLSEDIPLQCVHMTALNDDDIETLQNTGASVIHCPESNLKLASGFCEVERLMKAGVPVALGTDGAASNNDLDMLGEMRTAALLGKAVAKDASAVNAYNALKMATIEGARALGIEDVCGSLEPGKAADMIAVDLRQLNTSPRYDLISDMVYAASPSQVSHVWIAGKAQLMEGELCHLDSQEIMTKAQSWADKIRKSDQQQ